MTIFIIALHVIACLGLIAIVLIQRGRSSGLVESFSGVESMFGTKTNTFLTRTTSVLSVVFFLTCLSLAVLSVKQSRSLMRDIKSEVEKQPVPELPKVNEEAAAQAPLPQGQALPIESEPQEVPQAE
jgi:preprotein translocase subunit SecG